tara:strand:- start:69 stop:449 length:381 start_codon:yes stop_codon:yes gene_type:complete
MIVVVILGILAAIIVPQFADAQSAARATAMRTQLNTIRSQISAWRLQNGNAVPGGVDSDAGQMIQALIDDGYMVRTVSLSPGFTWVWNATRATLSLGYEVSIDPGIPDADNDGDGDLDDIAVIEAW